ncbi:MAG: 50S ribosomal protein L29 [Phototrophicales bacterium]|nr:MAG: 50S ribosomal protein L29 [Phototrophicales bacterium]
MRASEIRELPDREILKAIEEAKRELFKLRFQREVGQLEDSSRMRKVKRDIARLKTILRERQLAKELVKKENRNAQ